MINIDKFKELLEDLEQAIVDLVVEEGVGYQEEELQKAKDKVTEARRELINYVVMASRLYRRGR